MSNRPGKMEMLEALSAANVVVAPTTSIAQLRRLYAELEKTDIEKMKFYQSDDDDDTFESDENAAYEEENAAIAEKNAAIAERNAAIAKKNAVTVEKNFPIGNDSVISERKPYTATVSESIASTSSAANFSSMPTSFASPPLRIAAQIPAAKQHSVIPTADLDSELDKLRKRKEILELKRQIAELEGATVQPAGAPEDNRTNFSDIEFAIPKFAGDDKIQDVRHFFRDFEEVMQTARANNSLKLLGLRRSLTGAARVFLQSTNALDYNDLKEALIAEFDVAVTRQDVYQLLRNRKWSKKDESVHHYALIMQAIARRSDIAETELIEFIVDGLNDAPNANLFLSARTVDELKCLLNRHQQRMARVHPPAVRDAPTRRPEIVKPTVKDDTVIRCYNCSRTNHYQSACPFPQRPSGSCFRCWEHGHDHRSCVNPKKVLIPMYPKGRQVAFAMPNTDDYTAAPDEALAAINSVSVAFYKPMNQNTVYKNIVSLFDTGSPVSFIRCDQVPFEVQTVSPLPKFCGLGGKRIDVKGEINCSIKFRKKTECLKIIVLPVESLNIPLILGRDFMRKFCINLVLNKIKYSKENLKKLNKRNNCVLDSLNSILGTYDLLKREIKINNSHAEIGSMNGFVSDEKSVSRSADIAVSIGLNKKVTYLTDILEVFSVTPMENKIDICEGLSQLDKVEFETLITSTYLKPKGILVEPLNYEMEIHLTSDAPFYCSPRRLSVQEKREVQGIIDELLAEGIIRPSNSAYSSAIVLVNRKDGRRRLCVDYRGLNKVTVRDNYPLPLIEDCLEYLEGKRYFSLLDLKNGFHQVKIADTSIKYTSFVTPGGQYEYVRMPFGLKNAPAIFQRFINTIFRDLIDQGKIIIYLDDIFLATDTLEEHRKLLAEVLTRTALRGLKLNLEKCKFGYQEIEYLGYAVSHKGIGMSKAHTSAISQYPVPTNVREVQSCLGLFSYFRRFVPSFSKIARPLQNLLHKNTVFNFDQRCFDSFFELKNKLLEAPILSIYSPKRVTELHCDGSSIGFGAALMQKQDDGRFHPVAYFSKTTSVPESRYHSFELEALAIIYALRRFRVYLEGIHFKIISDCNSLAMTLEKKQVNPRIARWALELENYNYIIQHRAGSSMTHVDALSRCRQIAIADANDVDFRLQIAQSRDPIVLKLKNKLENEELTEFVLKDGLVYRKEDPKKLLFYVPLEMEENVIRMIHEKIGHQSVDKCYDKLKLHYWFPKMRAKIGYFIRNCIKCILYSPPVRSTERNLYNIPKKPVPFHTIHVDHFGPLPSLLSKRKHILMIVDAFTKYTKLYAVNSTSTNEVNACLDRYFEYYSRPVRIITDRGSGLKSYDFEEFLLDRNIGHVKIATASAQANGQVERANRVLKAVLGKLSEPINHADWSRLLLEVEYSLNTTIHKTTKQMPCKLLFGVEQRGCVIDEFTEHLNEKIPIDCPVDLVELRTDALESLERSQKYNAEYVLRHSKPAKTYEVGDYVVIRNVDTVIGTNKKFIPKYRGPYIVHKKLGRDRYVIRDIENCQLTQMPYDGVLEANKMRKWQEPINIRKIIDTVDESDTFDDGYNDENLIDLGSESLIGGDQNVRLEEL